MKLFWNQYFKLFSFCKSRKRNCKTFCSGFTETWIQTWTCVETLRRLPTDVRFSFMTKINFFKRKNLSFFIKNDSVSQFNCLKFQERLKCEKGAWKVLLEVCPSNETSPVRKCSSFCCCYLLKLFFIDFWLFFSSSFSWKFNFGKYFSHWFTAIVTKRSSQFTPA